MPALLLLACLNASDAPLLSAPLTADSVSDVRMTLNEPEPSGSGEVPHLLGWGFTLSSMGVSMMAVSAVMFGMLSSASAQCRATAGCFDESGLAYLAAALPLLAGFVNAAVGLPMLGRGLHVLRTAD